MLEEHLSVPFETTVLSARVTVDRLDPRDDNRIAAICARGRERQIIAIQDLPPPSPGPTGAEWIDAYRHWLGR